MSPAYRRKKSHHHPPDCGVQEQKCSDRKMVWERRKRRDLGERDDGAFGEKRRSNEITRGGESLAWFEDEVGERKRGEEGGELGN